MAKGDIQLVKEIDMRVRVRAIDIKRIVARYPIGRLIVFFRLKKGFANYVYAIRTTTGRYVLKVIIRNNYQNRVQYEVDLLNRMKGLPTPQLLKTQEGQYLPLINGENRVLLYKWLPGKQAKKITSAMLGQVGKFLGRMHRQTKGFRSSASRIELYNINHTKARSIIMYSQKVREKDLKVWLPAMYEGVERYRLPASLPSGAMHIDLKPENTLFEGKKLTGVVDFDNSYNGPLVLDLANTIMWYCSKEGEFNMQAAKIIFKSYDKVRRLSGQERRRFVQALRYAQASHVFVNMYWLALKKLPAWYLRWGIRNIYMTGKNLPGNIDALPYE
jgi:homoserine kinase type II